MNVPIEMQEIRTEAWVEVCLDCDHPEQCKESRSCQAFDNVVEAILAEKEEDACFI